jgi:CheY-like chemotaxis protein
MPQKIILTVDDEPHILDLVKAIFEAEGYKVLTASSGKEALEVLKTNKPDLVLIDMMMPEMSGRELAENIRRDPKTKDIKLAFLTVAQFSEIGRKTLENLGVDEYITKPFDNEDLVKKIKRLLA